MNGTLLVARPWSNKAQLVMARVGGCTLFRRNGGEAWVHSKSLKKCRCAEHHSAGHYDKIMEGKAQELLEKPDLAWHEANGALEGVTRETSADDCLAAHAREAEACRVFKAAVAALEKFRQEELPGKAEAAAVEARKKFGEQMTPILEAQRKLALEKYGDNLAEHVKFAI